MRLYSFLVILAASVTANGLAGVLGAGDVGRLAVGTIAVFLVYVAMARRST